MKTRELLNYLSPMSEWEYRPLLVEMIESGALTFELYCRNVITLDELMKILERLEKSKDNK